MDNENIFSGIPALDDAQGLEQYVSNAAVEGLGMDSQIPAALQQVETQPAQQPAQTAPQAQPQVESQPASPTYTSEQVAQIISHLRNANSTPAAQRSAAPTRAIPAAQPQQAPYTPQQVAIMKQLLDRGVPLERIMDSLRGNRQNMQQQQALVSRLQNIEQYLQNQQYQAAESAFITKMTAFGDKFGLSEQDLVTFGNQAMSMGINLTQVNDVEAVFRAVYPEQYAIRSQRIAGANASHIYGGASANETPRAAASKLEDAYVDAFLKQAMPNQYGMHSK